MIEVLNETTQRELDYIFWNKFRIDPNGDKSIEFFEFVRFLFYLGSIYLRSFRRNCAPKVPSPASEGKVKLNRRITLHRFQQCFLFFEIHAKRKKSSYSHLSKNRAWKRSKIQCLYGLDPSGPRSKIYVMLLEV